MHVTLVRTRDSHDVRRIVSLSGRATFCPITEEVRRASRNGRSGELTEEAIGACRRIERV
jgi:hypothetical protein